MRFDKLFFAALLFVLATVPLLFGARHPLIHGIYNCLLLLFGGGWLLLNSEARPGRLRSFSRLAPLVILLFIALTSISLPFFLLDLISPVRAKYLAEAMRIADLPEVASTLSYYAPAATFYAFYVAALIFFFYATRSFLRDKANLTRVLWVITLVGFFEAVYGLLQATNPALGVLWLPPSFDISTGYARGTIIYRNQYAAFLNMCWPMALALGISLGKSPAPVSVHPRRRRDDLLKDTKSRSQLLSKAVIPFWCATLMILAVIFSQSRGGILFMLVNASLFMFLYSYTLRRKTLFAGALLLVIAIYGSMIGFAEVNARFATFYESALVRFAIWGNSLNMLQDHLFTGIGMGGYEFLSPAYLKDIPEQIWWDRAHNEYVELAIELGLPVMLLAMAWLGMGMVGYGTRLLSRKKERWSPSLHGTSYVAAVAAFCGLVGLLMHGLVDFVWRLPAVMVYAVVLLAVLSAHSSTAVEDEEESEEEPEYLLTEEMRRDSEGDQGSSPRVVPSSPRPVSPSPQPSPPSGGEQVEYKDEGEEYSGDRV